MEFIYQRLDICILLDKLKNEEISKTLAYMIDFKEYDNLVVSPKSYSIEISNAEICIAILVFSGFEKEEYQALKIKKNHHVVSFDLVSQTMLEFENIPIKHIDYAALFFMSMTRSENKTVKDFLSIYNLKGNETIYQLRKNKNN